MNLQASTAETIETPTPSDENCSAVDPPMEIVGMIRIDTQSNANSD